MAEEIPIIMAGGATSVPGQTKEESAAIVMALLQLPADGHHFLPSAGQRNEWLHRKFLTIGNKSWTFFKKQYKDDI